MTDEVAKDNTGAVNTEQETAQSDAATTTTETAATTNETQKETPAAPVVPETYAAPELPEGMVMDEAALAEFMPLAKKAGMTQESFNEAIGLYAKNIGAVVGKMAAHRDAQYTEVMTEIKADPTLGGQTFEANIGKINAVITKFGGAETVETFHQAVAQLAAFDKAKAKSLYVTLDKIARAASIPDKVITGDQKPPAGERYPGLK